MLDEFLVVLEPQNFVSEEEVRGQMPGTTRGGARTKSAINNNQASRYVRARGVVRYRRPTFEGRGIGCQLSEAVVSAVQYGASFWRHKIRVKLSNMFILLSKLKF